MLVHHSKRSKSRLRLDPTRTTLIRQRFVRDITRGFDRLKTAIVQLIEKEDAFGLKSRQHTPGSLVKNTRYQALTTPQQLTAFKQWVQGQIDSGILKGVDTGAKNWMEQYIREAYEKGSGRSFDDYMIKYKDYYKDPQGPYYKGTKDEFLRSSFRRPAAVERVQLLASRAYTDLKGVTEVMSTQMNRVLTDGIIQGKSPREVARSLNKTVEGIGKNRASTIARTETIRAHADGQLETLKMLGVEEVGVMVEWSTASDNLVCELCSSLDGAVLRIKDASGLIPRHPNCRCAWLPAGIGEDKTGQKRGAEAKSAIDKSIKSEIPTGLRGKRSFTEQKARSRWMGAERTKLAKPLKSPLDEVVKLAVERPSLAGPTIEDVEKARREYLSVKKRGLSSEIELRDKFNRLVDEFTKSTGQNYLDARAAWEASKKKAVEKSVPVVKDATSSVSGSGNVKERLEQKGLNIKALKVHAQIKPDFAVRLLEDTEKQLDSIAKAFPKANPAKWKGNKRIRLSFTNTDHITTSASKRAVGLYKRVGNKIQVATRNRTLDSKPIAWGEWNVGKSIGDTVRHEIGHHVEANFLTLDQKIAWETIAKEHVGKPWLVSQYGATNSSELFAESFSAYTHSGYGTGGRELPEAILKFFKGINLN